MPKNWRHKRSMRKSLASGSSEPIRNCKINENIYVKRIFGEMDFPEDWKPKWKIKILFMDKWT